MEFILVPFDILHMNSRLTGKIIFELAYKEEIVSFEVDCSWPELKGYTQGTLQQIIPDRVRKNSEQFGLPLPAWIGVALKQHTLFYQLPETIKDNLEKSAEVLGVSKEKYLGAVLRRPSLFCQLPETIEENVKASARALGVTKKEFVNAAIKQPSLFYQSPKTINKNVENSAEALGVTKKEFISAALKQPSLFTRSPEAVADNFKMICLNYSSREEALLRVFSSPVLLTFSQERVFIYNIVRSVIKTEFDPRKNPIKYFDKYVRTHNVLGPEGRHSIIEPEGLAKLKRILMLFEQEGKQDRREKKKNGNGMSLLEK